MRRLLTAAALIGALGVTGCSSSSSDTTESPAAPASASVSADGTYASDGVTVTGEAGSEPTVAIDSESEPPKELVSKVIVEGDGAQIQPESQVSVQYVGASWSNGVVFDSSWTGAGAVTFPLNGVIKGWQEGLVGIPQGSRVLLIIPPKKAYGENPPPGSGIAPNETLVFVVDIVEVL